MGAGALEAIKKNGRGRKDETWAFVEWVQKRPRGQDREVTVATQTGQMMEGGWNT